MARRRKRGDNILIPALARGVTTKRAAELAGVSERTVSRRRADPEFQREVDAIREQAIDQATGRLLAVADDAISTLAELLDAESETIRLGAARAILTQLLRLKELSEFEGRLQAIEDRLGVTA